MELYSVLFQKFLGNFWFYNLKGPKYRESQNIGFKQAREDILNGNYNCIVAWCQQKGVESAVLQQEKAKETQAQLQKVSQTTNSILKIMLSFKNPHIKHSLKQSHDQFTFTL